MAGSPIRIVVLGSGTSVGVPTIGCHCAVCMSTDPRDARLRPSILVVYEGKNILIDTTPDFRTQALRVGLNHLDAVLFTHAHADHVMGLDDVRPFNFRQSGRIPLYASADTLASIERIFSYIFEKAERKTNIPQIETRVLDGAGVDVHGLKFTPVPVMHGDRAIYGFRFGQAAYLTDHSSIPESSMEMLRGLDVLFLDALRYKPHPTHSTVDQSIRTVEELAPKRAFFTHICHDLGHARAESMLPAPIRLAYDGLELVVEGSE